MVATGTRSPVESTDTIDGNTRVTRRKTETPIRFAGFNLGDFQSASITENGYKIDVYANRQLGDGLADEAVAVAVQRRGFFQAAPRSATQPWTAPFPPACRSHRTPALLVKDVENSLDFMTAEFGPPPSAISPSPRFPADSARDFPAWFIFPRWLISTPDQRPSCRSASATSRRFIPNSWQPTKSRISGGATGGSRAATRDEWLMESLANYSALLLLEKNKGVKAVEAVLDDYRNHCSPSPILAVRWNPLDRSLGVSACNPRSRPMPGRSSPTRKELGSCTCSGAAWATTSSSACCARFCNRYRFGSISTEQFRELAAAFHAAANRRIGRSKLFSKIGSMAPAFQP